MRRKKSFDADSNEVARKIIVGFQEQRTRSARVDLDNSARSCLQMAEQARRPVRSALPVPPIRRNAMSLKDFRCSGPLTSSFPSQLKLSLSPGLSSSSMALKAIRVVELSRIYSAAVLADTNSRIVHTKRSTAGWQPLDACSPYPAQSSEHRIATAIINKSVQ